MCLIAFCWRPGESMPLVLAANRDEFHSRPTEPLHWWSWPQGPLAGRDAYQGGTWLAASRDGRFAAITNFRDPRAPAGPKSRGALPPAWLDSGQRPAEFARRVHGRRDEYSPFTLLIGGPEALVIVGSHCPPATVEPGIHALSNHLLDTPWPKSLRICRILEGWLANSARASPGGLLDLLDDREPAREGQLPDTGVGSEAERLLSAPFIVSPDYGTRSSSALVVGETIHMAERTFDPAGQRIGEIHFRWARGAW